MAIQPQIVLEKFKKRQELELDYDYSIKDFDDLNKKKQEFEKNSKELLTPLRDSLTNEKSRLDTQISQTKDMEEVVCKLKAKQAKQGFFMSLFKYTTLDKTIKNYEFIVGDLKRHNANSQKNIDEIDSNIKMEEQKIDLERKKLDDELNNLKEKKEQCKAALNEEIDKFEPELSDIKLDMKQLPKRQKGLEVTEILESIIDTPNPSSLLAYYDYKQSVEEGNISPDILPTSLEYELMGKIDRFYANDLKKLNDSASELDKNKAVLPELNSLSLEYPSNMQSNTLINPEYIRPQNETKLQNESSPQNESARYKSNL